MRIIFFVWMACISTVLMGQQEKEVDYVIKYDFVPILDIDAGTYDRPYEFLLMNADGISRFHSSNKQFNDSMKVAYNMANPQYANPQTQEETQAAMNHAMQNMRSWKKSLKVNYIIKKDFAQKIIYNTLPAAFPPQHLEESLELDWKISARQDSVLGLNCSMATTEYGGRKYTAWFAPSIPISDGPYVFSGLPGLIVQVMDDEGWFNFRLKGINVTSHIRFWKNNYISSSSRVISRESYVDQCRKQKNNPRMFGVSNVPEEKLLEMKERYANRHFMLLESY